jgi:RNA polymerase sigma-70 factor (ECF subfamily)
LDDNQLIERLMEGSEEAFLEMFEQYKGRIFNVVYRILGDPSECEDVVQEVFLKAFRNIGSFNHQSALYTWLYRIGVNAAVDYKKKFKRQGVVSLYRQDGTLHDLASEADGPDADPQRREMAGLLKGALDQLTEKHRTILILREFEGLSYDEIAEVLNCSKGTVESRLFRARGRLREKLEKFL